MKQILAILSVILLMSAPVLAQEIDYCEGNFDYDQDQDGSDAFKFKEDFGRSSMGNPCPPDGPAPVPKTGKIWFIQVGDDGALQKGVAWPNPRFTDNEDGSVTDNLTGLIWLKDANCFGQKYWDEALFDCNGLTDGSCGLTDGSQVGDWRLPNVKELPSLIDYEKFQYPMLPVGHPFLNVQSSAYPGLLYWTSTDLRSFGNSRFTVNLSYGAVEITGYDENHYVWCVRGGH